MDSEQSDNYNDEVEEIDDATHKRLIENVLNLNKRQHIKKPSRTEPTLEVSEFNLVKSTAGSKGTVHLSDLTKVLKHRAKHTDIGKKVKSTEKKAKTLPKPLEKPQAERIRRSVAYESTKKQLDKWDAVVTSNRAANTLSFPLEFDTKLEQKLLAKDPYRIKTELQKKLEALEPQVEVYNVDMALEEKVPLTMEEIMNKRKEAAKLRAHQSYKEAKARRQNKIKSKKYHRIQRREKIKLQLQEFETLQKTNPEAALKKLDEIERARAEERVSLRHKSTGQWAKNKQVRAKYDKESRQALAQQLTISKELTQKLKTDNSDSENEDVENTVVKKTEGTDNNIWTNGVDASKEVVDFLSGYRKFWEEKNKDIIDKEIIPKKEKDEDNTSNKNHVEKNKKSNNVGEIKLEKPDINIEKNSNTASKKVAAKKVVSNILKENKRTKKKLKVSGTSNWDVTPVKFKKCNNTSKATADSKSDSDEEGLDKMLNKMEANMEKKLREKYNKVTKGLETVEGKHTNNKASSKKKKKKNKKIDLSLHVEAKRPKLDDELTELPMNGGENHEQNDSLQKLKSILKNSKQEEKAAKAPIESIDPNKIANTKPTLLDSDLPDLALYGEDEEDEEPGPIQMEGFEEDDLFDEFKKEKQEEVDKDKPKDIDLNLPGWGTWGGTNIKESKRKRKRFIIKMPKKIPRRDDNKGDVVINENANQSLKPHLVSELPFPFKSVKDYEASIRNPIGSTFVPETAFRKLTQPAITTKMGTIIEPISEDILIKKMKKH